MQKYGLSVAPYVGAWIETAHKRYTHDMSFVAPYVGAWIETYIKNATKSDVMSHPTWVRGLKHHRINVLKRLYGRTLRGCVD